MQPIAFRKIDSRHSNPPSTFIALIIAFNSFAPEFPRLIGTSFAETDIDEKITVFCRGFE
jgi:hypothetical protein